MSVFLTIKRSAWSWLGFPRCESLTSLMSQAMDHKISFRARMMIRLHFLGCRKCARYQKQLRLISNLAKNENQKDAAIATSGNETLSTQARERMKVALARAAENIPHSAPAVDSD